MINWFIWQLKKLYATDSSLLRYNWWIWQRTPVLKMICLQDQYSWLWRHYNGGNLRPLVVSVLIATITSTESDFHLQGQYSWWRGQYNGGIEDLQSCNFLQEDPGEEANAAWH